MADNQNQDPETIERDIERTQDAIGDTVEKIEEKLTPSEVTRSILGEDGQDAVREALRMARDNPVPTGMIAVGAIGLVWLLATSDSPMVKRMSDHLGRSIRGPNSNADGLRSRNEEPAPIGPPPAHGAKYDRRSG